MRMNSCNWPCCRKEGLSSSYYGVRFAGFFCTGIDCCYNSVCIQNKRNKGNQSPAGELQ